MVDAEAGILECSCEVNAAAKGHVHGGAVVEDVYGKGSTDGACPIRFAMAEQIENREHRRVEYPGEVLWQGPKSTLAVTEAGQVAAAEPENVEEIQAMSGRVVANILAQHQRADHHELRHLHRDIEANFHLLIVAGAWDGGNDGGNAAD